MSRRPDKYRLAVLAGVLCLMGLTACLQELVLEIPAEEQSGLVIRGHLLQAEVPLVRVEVTQLSAFADDEPPRALSGAIVILMDDQNNSLEIPQREAGIYELEIPDQTYELEVKEGRSYQLMVATPNGKTYASTIENLHPVPEPLALNVNSFTRDVLNGQGNIQAQEFLQFQIDTPLEVPGQTDYANLKWEFFGTYKFQESNLTSPYPNTRTCFFTEILDPDRVVTFEGAESADPVLRNFLLLDEPLDYRFTEGFYLTVRQLSLSQEALRYWEGIGQVVERSGNFFEPQPGKIRGNFRNIENDQEEVFGYFFATQERIIRLYVPPGENRVMPFCPLNADPGDKSVPAICLDCQSHPGSTLTKPDYWKE